jgi:hypothetical protein
MKKTIQIMTFCILLYSIAASAQVSPAINWKTMQTAHFTVIFDASQQPVAELFASRLETIYSIIAPVFPNTPEKTVVVLNDSTDVTNGYATAIPYPMIMLYPVLPSPSDVLSEYGDWAFELALHEYIHVLSFAPTSGAMKVLRNTFGTIIAPNMLLPRWWLEGIAVWGETRWSQHGRLRSPFQEAMVRSWVLDQRWKDFDFADINESTIPTWPGGSRPYIFGSLLWTHLIAQHGEKAIANLHEAYGARIPFIIEQPLIDLAQANHENLFGAMKYDVEDKARKQLRELSFLTPTPLISLEIDSKEQNFPQISPDGRFLLYVNKDLDNKKALVVLERPSLEIPFDSNSKKIEFEAADSIDPKKTQDAPPTGSIGRARWFNDSTRIIFDKIDEINRFQSYSDIYIYNLKEKTSTRVTKGMRARDASPSIDGSQIAFVKLEASSTQLAVMNLAQKTAEIVYRPALQHRISNPIWTSETEIIFSERDSSGHENLVRVDVNKKETVVLQSPFKVNSLISLSANNSATVLTPDSGVLNLHSLNLATGKSQPISHVETALLAGDIDPSTKDFYVSKMTADGPRLFRFTEASKVAAEKLPTAQPMVAQQIANHTTAQNNLPENEINDYKPGQFLWPKYWMPFLSTGSTGTYLQVSTATADPLAKHAYSAAIAYDSYISKANWNFAYLNNTLEPEITISGSEFYSQLIQSSILTRDLYGSADIAWPLTSWNPDLSGSMGWSYKQKSLAQISAQRVGPRFTLKYGGVSQGPTQISPEKGHVGIAQYVNYLPEMGDFGYQQMHVMGEVYLSKWLPAHHVTYLSASILATDKALPFIYGTPTVAQKASSAEVQVPMRGFLAGQFVSSQLLASTIEYRFPINNIYKGKGTLPLYLKRLHGAAIFDSIINKGFSYSLNKRAFLTEVGKKVYSSAGFEANLDTTIGYHMPLTFTFAYYLPVSQELGGSGTFFLGLKL